MKFTAQHPNHYSIFESVDCEKCNPYELTEHQYRRVLNDGNDPSAMDESDVLVLQQRGILPTFYPLIPKAEEEQ